MKVIGIGDLVCDLYYIDNKFIGLSGGKSFANIIFNLSYLKINTAIIGTVGNDIFGKIAAASLEKAGVNTEKIIILDTSTKLFHIDIKDKKISTRSICPHCHSKKSYNYDYPKLNLNKNNVIVIDSIKYLRHLYNQKLVMIDIGYYNELEKLNDEEIKSVFEFRFEMINMNNKVSKYLISRFKLKSEKDIYKLLNTRILIITKGKKGASYYYENTDLHLKPQNISKEIDPNGAGDLFFAVHIKNHLLNEFKINSTLLKDSFEEANDFIKEGVKLIGARSYFQPLFKGKKSPGICTCQNLNIID